VLYMDYWFLMGEEEVIEGCKVYLVLEFEMDDIGLMHYFLGLQVCKRLGRDISWSREVHNGDPEEI
jgi:hypothetical protein